MLVALVTISVTLSSPAVSVTLSHTFDVNQRSSKLTFCPLRSMGQWKTFKPPVGLELSLNNVSKMIFLFLYTRETAFFLSTCKKQHGKFFYSSTLIDADYVLSAALELDAKARKEHAEDPPSKRARLYFTDSQKRALFAIFKETKKPSREMQNALAEELGLERGTVANFFMNARRRHPELWESRYTFMF